MMGEGVKLTVNFCKPHKSQALNRRGQRGQTAKLIASYHSCTTMLSCESALKTWSLLGVCLAGMSIALQAFAA